MTPPLPSLPQASTAITDSPPPHHYLEQRADGLYKVERESGREWRLVWRQRADDVDGESRWYISEFAWVPVELLARDDGKEA